MITVETALEIVKNKTIRTESVKTVVLAKALNHVLSADVLSPINMPPFPQSAMDGYAVNCYDKNEHFQLIGEVAAGQKQEFLLGNNQAVRIFTGAEVPNTANMVVRQEDVQRYDNEIKVDVFPSKMANIRAMGEQIKSGDIALQKGHRLNAASIGFLTSIGVSKVQVYELPKIAIIATGSELVPATETLQPGQIYDSNSTMLATSLQSFGYSNATVFKIEDDYQKTVNTVANCLNNFDLMICSGGISVGDYDFIGKALAENQVKTHFYKVKQKPGKPLYFGQKNSTYVFGLPGNPAACLTGFYIYILPFLSKFKGGTFSGLPIHSAKLSAEYSRKGDRAEFLKGRVENGVIKILEGQSSAMLKSFSYANAIIYIPINKTNFAANDWVNYYELL